jgi:eukaryotic-like serine/threonine-protein kinase
VLEFIRSKTFLLNLLLAIGLVILILLGTYYWMSAYTNHGEAIVVPDVKGKQWKVLEKELAARNLKFKISDSSIFIVDKPGGLVIEQDPAPGSKVKENRTIYVSVSRIVPPQVKIPAIIDVSDRQAEAILMSYGLKTGMRTYKPDLAKNAVLELMFKDRTLKPGDEVPKGSVIDLVLGDGVGSTDLPVPPLLNSTYDEAVFILKASGLAVGTVEFDDDVSDTSNAVIYRTYPEQGDTVMLKQGQSINLYFKKGN